MKHIYFLLLYVAMATSAWAQFKPYRTPAREAHEDSITTRYLKNGAWKHSYLTREWQQCIDSGLAVDSTVAYLWQQKGMPLWKTRKYELAEAATERCVYYDSLWVDYLGFCRLIFKKDHRRALQDFAAAKRIKPGGYVMDHSYPFYEALCYLQLNKYDSALIALKMEIERGEAAHGKTWTHYLDMMYMGIIYYELGKYDEALTWLDRSLDQYARFSDAKYYKALTLRRLGKVDEANALITQAKKDHEAGNTINEDNVGYEPYPYQVTWQWRSAK